MTREDIIRMAREAGVSESELFPREQAIERFANLVATAEREKLKEPIRIRIMSAALDCADEGDTESYNTVKVMCSDVLEMLNEPR